jgi:hypothetical protein
MSYMRAERVISSREFQQQFAKLSKELQPGQTIAVTNRGERIGTYTRARKGPRQAPNFYANLQKLGHSKAAGQRMIKQIINELS